MIIVLGNKGAQGKRYEAILKQANIPFKGVDLNADEFFGVPPLTIKDIKAASGVIIATPTDTHSKIVREYLDLEVPILVEKPVCKDLTELKSLLADVAKVNGDLSMVFQYAWLASHHESKEHSSYNYFRHGNDGLVWDCLQIIALAKGRVHLKEDSPVWNCTINGLPLNIKDMDQAYVLEVTEWLSGTRTLSLDSIYKIHEKVAKHKL